MPRDDPTEDIYRILDAAKLGVTKFSSMKSMTRIINEVRTDIAQQFTSYIKARDQKMFDAGYAKGKHEANQIQDGQPTT